jgi:hypothetical protein
MLKDKRNWHLDGVKPVQTRRTNLENRGEPSAEGQTSVDEGTIDGTWNAKEILNGQSNTSIQQKNLRQIVLIQEMEGRTIYILGHYYDLRPWTVGLITQKKKSVDAHSTIR